MSWHTWLLYLVAAIGLSVTPGPNSLLVLTHGALARPPQGGLHGRRQRARLHGC
jgi:threonine/homoserine/homoserine lactone efflux protein